MGRGLRVAEGVRGLVVFIARGLAIVVVVVVCGDLAAAWAEEPLEAAMTGAWGCGEEECVGVEGSVCWCVDVRGLRPSGLGRRGLWLAAAGVERCGCCGLLVGVGAAAEELWVRGEVVVVVVAAGISGGRGDGPRGDSDGRGLGLVRVLLGLSGGLRAEVGGSERTVRGVGFTARTCEASVEASRDALW